MLLVLIAVVSVWFPRLVVEGGDTFPPEPEFSGRLVVSVNGKQRQAQVFGKGDRLRLEYKYAVRTERGFAAIEIIRPDYAEVWYVLPQQRELLVMPLAEDIIPTRPKLSGETTRTLIGPAMVADRPARLFDVQTERHGRGERFYEWVDEEMDIVLKLVSQDRDWSFQYERIRKSHQPAMYFEGPPGYKKRASSTR
ncbi:MAG: hypothetical protein AABY61_05020 [Nitrospirota bacterium]